MKSQRRRQKPALPAHRHRDANSFPTGWHFHTSSSQPGGVPAPRQLTGLQGMPGARGSARFTLPGRAQTHPQLATCSPSAPTS